MLIPLKWHKKSTAEGKTQCFHKACGTEDIKEGRNITPEVKVLLRGKMEAQDVQGASTKTWKMLDEDFAYHGIEFFSRKHLQLLLNSS